MVFLLTDGMSELLHRCVTSSRKLFASSSSPSSRTRYRTLFNFTLKEDHFHKLMNAFKANKTYKALSDVIEQTTRCGNENIAATTYFCTIFIRCVTTVCFRDRDTGVCNNKKWKKNPNNILTIGKPFCRFVQLLCQFASRRYHECIRWTR